MFEEQEVVQFSSPEPTIPSPASIEAHHEEGDPIDKGLRRANPEDKARGSSKFSNGATSQIKGVQDIHLSDQTENSEAIGIVDQQATWLTSRPKSVEHKLPDIDKNTTPPPRNSPTSFLNVDDDGKPQDLSNTTVEAQKRTRSKALTRVRVPSAAFFDPFNAIPITSTERVRVLVHYCKMTSSSLLSSSPFVLIGIVRWVLFRCLCHAIFTNLSHMLNRPFIICRN